MESNAREVMQKLDFDKVSTTANLDFGKYLQRTKDFLKLMDVVGKGEKALDIGIGTGWYAKIMAELYGYHVTGLGQKSDQRFLSNYELSNVDLSFTT